jgi:hypothetical protein
VLSLNSGTIADASSEAPQHSLCRCPAPWDRGAQIKPIVIDTTAPTVVSYLAVFGARSYDLIGSSHNRLPWQITGITVTFSKPIATGNPSSLGGVTPPLSADWELATHLEHQPGGT